MSVRCVIFDIGGTLLMDEKAECDAIMAGVEWSEIIKWGYRVSKEKYIVAATSVQEKYKTIYYSRRTNLRLSKMILRKLGVPVKNELARNMNESFIKYKKNNIFPPRGVEKVLQSLKNNNITLSIVSNTLTRRSVDRLEKLNLLHYFDQIILSFEVGVSKPDPKIFRILVDRLNNINNNRQEKINFCDCIMVGNEVTDMEPAYFLGMKAVFFGNAKNKPPFSVLLSNFSDLPKIIKGWDNYS